MVQRRHVIAVLAIMAATAGALVGTTSVANAETNVCHEVEHTVSGLPGAPGDHQIAGTLCASPDDTTIQLLVPGGTYGRVYWDFPYEPETYSYVRAMNDVGLATLNIDRFAMGASSHPPSSQVTAQANIEAIHQVIGALRGGDFGQQFTKVVLVGHSLGTMMSIGVAAFHPADADGLIATGLSHGLGLSGWTEVMVNLIRPYPANSEERFSDLDDGYFTTPPGAREVFYHLPAADPEVMAVDEETKETATVVEFLTATSSLISTLAVDVPVLAVVGDRDRLFCDPFPCSSPLSPWNLEQTFYLNSPNFQRLVIPNSGHNITLHPNANAFYNKATAWVTTVIGVD